MNKNIILAILIVSSMILCSCEKKNDTATVLSSNGSSYTVVDYVDPDTGVHYLLFKWGYGLDVKPRYNSDGTIMVGEIRDETTK